MKTTNAYSINPTIWIVDDDTRFCAHLQSFLIQNQYTNTSVFYAGDSVVEFLRQNSPSPDVVLLDINFSDEKMSGYDFLKIVKPMIPDAKVIVMTSFGEDEHVRFTLKHGAIGFINKTQGPQDVVHAIRVALDGGVFVEAGTLSRVVSSSVRDNITERYNFTPREEEILEYLLDGASVPDVADKGYISLNTVNYHIKNIYKKTSVNSRSQLIAKLTKEKAP